MCNTKDKLLIITSLLRIISVMCVLEGRCVVLHYFGNLPSVYYRTVYDV